MKNKGMHQYRFKDNPMEKLYAEVWEDQNLNIHKEDGRGTLDYMLAIDSNTPKGEVTERDKVVAATVIQWLGSPVGQFFIGNVLEKQERSNKEKITKRREKNDNS